MTTCKYCEQAAGEFHKKNHAVIFDVCNMCYTNFIEELFGNNHGENCPCHACKYYRHKEEWDYWLDEDYQVTSNFLWRINEVLHLLDNPPQQHPGQLTIHDFLEP